MGDGEPKDQLYLHTEKLKVVIYHKIAKEINAYKILYIQYCFHLQIWLLN